MKTIKSLFLIPFVALTSCSMEQRISQEKASNIADQINEAISEDEEVGVQYKMMEQETEIRGSKSETTQYTFLMKTNDSGAYYKLNLNEKGYEQSLLLYYLPSGDPYYGGVIYVRTKGFDASDKDNIIVKTTKTNPDRASYGSLYKESFSYTYQSYMDYLSSYIAGATVYENPVDLMRMADIEPDDDEDATKMTYYSSGRGNLTVKATQGKNKAVFKYNKNRFKGLEMVYETSASEYKSTNYKLKRQMKIAASYSKSLKITLPTNWKNYIEDASDD